MATRLVRCPQQQAPICVVQNSINPGVNSRADTVQLGYLTYPPFMTPAPTPAHMYTCGYNSQGKIIGNNVAVPYPTSSHVYKPRSSTNEQLAGSSANNENKTLGCEPEEVSPEIDEYFTAENDEGYQKWAEKKTEAEKKKSERHKASPTRVIPPQAPGRCTVANNVPVSLLDTSPASHYLPTKLITTNQRYGRFIDLTGNYFIQRIVRKKEGRTEPRLVDSASFLPTEQRSHPLDVHNLALHHVASQKVPYNNIVPRNIFSLPTKGDVMGVREEGYTFPVYSKTGLELNRPCPVGASLFASMHKQPLHRRPPLKSVNPVSVARQVHFPRQQAVCLPYSTMRPQGCYGNPATQTPITFTCMQANGPMLS